VNNIPSFLSVRPGPNLSDIFRYSVKLCVWEKVPTTCSERVFYFCKFCSGDFEDPVDRTFLPGPEARVLWWVLLQMTSLQGRMRSSMSSSGNKEFYFSSHSDWKLRFIAISGSFFECCWEWVISLENLNTIFIHLERQWESRKEIRP